MNAETSPSTVLVIEDEAQMRKLLRISLEADGYRVIESNQGQLGIIEAPKRRPDIILLDLGLPDMDGIQVLRRIREWSNVPIVVLTVRDNEEAKLEAFEVGADDYVTKPFSTGELLARLRVARRHAQPVPTAAVYKTGALEVDLTSRTVKLNGNLVRLTSTEYALLRLFVRHPGRMLTHDKIMTEIWGPNQIEQIQYLRVYMTRLREKIESDPMKPKLLVTEIGVGYRLVEQ